MLRFYRLKCTKCDTTFSVFLNISHDYRNERSQSSCIMELHLS